MSRCCVVSRHSGRCDKARHRGYVAVRASAKGASAPLQKRLSKASSAQEVLGEVASGLEHFDRIHIATALHRLATFSAASDGEVPEPAEYARLIDAAWATIGEQDAQGVANILWSCASLEITPPEEGVKTCLRTLHSQGSRAKPQALANALWALADMQVAVDRESLRHLLGIAAERTEEMGAQDVATTLWGGAKLSKGFDESDEEELRFVLQSLRRASELAEKGSLPAQEGGMVLWALGFSGWHLGEEGVQLLSRIVQQGAHSFDAQAIGTACWALGRMRIDLGSGPMSCLAEAYVQQGRMVSVLTGASVVWGMAKCGRNPGQAVLQLADSRMAEGIEGAGRKEVLALLSGLMDLGFEPSEELLEGAGKKLEQHADGMDLEDHFDALKCIQKLGGSLPGRLLQAAYERIERCAETGEATTDPRPVLNAMMQLSANGYNLFSERLILSLLESVESSDTGLGHVSGLVQSITASGCAVDSYRISSLVHRHSPSEWRRLRPREASRLVRSLGSLRAYPGTPQLDAIASSLAENAALLDSVSLDCLLGGLADLRYDPRGSFIAAMTRRARWLLSAGYLDVDSRFRLMESFRALGAPVQRWRFLEPTSDPTWSPSVGDDEAEGVERSILTLGSGGEDLQEPEAVVE